MFSNAFWKRRILHLYGRRLYPGRGNSTEEQAIIAFDADWTESQAETRGHVFRSILASLSM
jgi:hypothetical protein